MQLLNKNCASVQVGKVGKTHSVKPAAPRPAVLKTTRQSVPSHRNVAVRVAEAAPVEAESQPVALVSEKKGVNIVFKSWSQEPSAKIPGQTVVITGGSQGVGRAMAVKCAEAGFNVVVLARSVANLEEAGKIAASAKAAGGKSPAVMAVSVDITNEEEVRALAAAAGEMFESVDVLINNAGFCATGSVEDTPMEATRNLMEVNFMGHVVTTQAMLPMLRASALKAKTRQGSPGAGVPGPSIVMVNSFAARIPLKNMGAYTAAKYALVGFTDVLRDELSGTGIHVGTVNPGVIKSNFLERAQWYGAQGDKARETMNTTMQNAAGIVQTPEEVASAVFECAIGQKQTEINVGPIFNGAIQSYKFTGANIFSMVPN